MNFNEFTSEEPVVEAQLVWARKGTKLRDDRAGDHQSLREATERVNGRDGRRRIGLPADQRRPGHARRERNLDYSHFILPARPRGSCQRR